MTEAAWSFLMLANNAMEASLFLLMINRKLDRGWQDRRHDTVFAVSITLLLTLAQRRHAPPYPLMAISYLLYTAYSVIFKEGELKYRLLWPAVAHLIFLGGNLLLYFWVSSIPTLNWEILSSHDTVRLIMLLFYSLQDIVAFLLIARPTVEAPVMPRWMGVFLASLAVGALVLGGVFLDLTPMLLTYPELASVISICFIGLYVLTISGFFLFDRQAIWTSRAFQLQAQVARVGEEQKDLQNLLDGYDNLKGLWHDIKQHFGVLLGLAEKQSYDEMQRYIIEVLHQDFIPVRDLLFSGHPHLDALLFVKSQYARRLGIELERRLVIPKELPISNSDFVAIMGNILDNAMEALERVPPEQRYLRLHASIYRGMWIIEVTNASNGIYRRNPRGDLVSTKPGLMRGIGLRRIYDMVTAAGGVVEIEPKESSFCIRLHFPLLREEN
ncbi:MAG: ATP-binding protein [Symbiobacteriaceae bacterium]|nr:ATP-binding protein [Symbiobacteriaceae bacterium]